MIYATNEEVYPKIGVTSSAISTSIIDTYIEEAIVEVESLIKTSCIPQTKVITFKGNGRSYYTINDLLLLNVLAININGTDLDMNTISFKETGLIELTEDASYLYFSSSGADNCSIKYTYGWLENGRVQDETSEAIEAGEVEVSITNSAKFTIGDYIKISGMDGNSEVVQITAKNLSTNTITCTFMKDHESGSLITRLQIPKKIKDLVILLAAIKGASYMIGNTYTFATNYSMPDYTVTKGVPYPHFAKNLEANIQQRDFALNNISQMPVIA